MSELERRIALAYGALPSEARDVMTRDGIGIDIEECSGQENSDGSPCISMYRAATRTIVIYRQECEVLAAKSGGDFWENVGEVFRELLLEQVAYLMGIRMKGCTTR